jgi:hypothetical protein
MAKQKMKIVGKQVREDPIETSRTLQKNIAKLRGPRVIPRGVYRFTTFEEADTWMTKMMARTHASQKLKTS